MQAAREHVERARRMREQADQRYAAARAAQAAKLAAHEATMRTNMQPFADTHRTIYLAMVQGRWPVGMCTQWTCVLGHRWQSENKSTDTRILGMCPECPRECRSCDREVRAGAYVVGNRLLKTCPDCRAQIVKTRRATAERAYAERMRVVPGRPEARLDEMDDDVLVRVLRQATAAAARSAPCVLLIARLVCRKMERCAFEHASSELGELTGVTRSQVVWFMSGLGPRALSRAALVKAYAVPEFMLRGEHNKLVRCAEAIRAAIRLHGSPAACSRFKSLGTVDLEARLLERLMPRLLGAAAHV